MSVYTKNSNNLLDHPIKAALCNCKNQKKASSTNLKHVYSEVNLIKAQLGLLQLKLIIRFIKDFLLSSP